MEQSSAAKKSHSLDGVWKCRDMSINTKSLLVAMKAALGTILNVAQGEATLTIRIDGDKVSIATQKPSKISGTTLVVGQGTYYTHLPNGAKVGVTAVWKGETLAVTMGPLLIERQGVGDRMVQTITLNGVSATRTHYRVKETSTHSLDGVWKCRDMSINTDSFLVAMKAAMGTILNVAQGEATLTIRVDGDKVAISTQKPTKKSGTTLVVGQGTYYTHLPNGAKVGVTAVWKGETLAVTMGPLLIERQGFGDRMVQTITLNGVSATRTHYRVQEKSAIGSFPLDGGGKMVRTHEEDKNSSAVLRTRLDALEAKRRARGAR